jgi:hypothetical protein
MKLACPGCSLELEEVEGPADAYGGASPACWALYGEAMAREFSSPEFFAGHRVSVDAYMTQHPSKSSRAAIQSVWVHLAGLYLVLEKNHPAPARVMAKLVETKREYEWLAPPAVRGGVTVKDVLAAPDAKAHVAAARRWAEAVWAAWEPHHPRIREWLSHASTW